MSQASDARSAEVTRSQKSGARPAEDERQARLGLAAAGEPGDARLADLVTRHGAVELWRHLRRGPGQSALARRAQTVDLPALIDQTAALGQRFVVPGDDEWPDRLGDLVRCSGVDSGGAPLGLWLAGPGRLDRLVEQAVAMVGARASTAYGEHIATDLAAGLAERGHGVVSGGAYGIDGASHRAALAVGGATLAIMAGGLGQLYPAGHIRLLERIRDEQVLVSEHPPDRRPSRSRFLARNRLIAALGLATVVVEGSVRSGAANSARWALALGRPVLAVPGPVTSATSATPHRLIRDQEAVLVATVEDVLEAISPLDPARAVGPVQPSQWWDGLSEPERAVYEEIPGRGDITVDELAERSGETVVELIGRLSRLRERGLVQPTERGGWRLVRGGRAGTGLVAEEPKLGSSVEG
ncbi:MAG: DNA-processing protein DprA [Propionibacteriaceae bacterium]|jgi:DNA processing protein|nr:DNA-processing protein DprA [Propionibacteriaceae bacterium]